VQAFVRLAHIKAGYCTVKTCVSWNVQRGDQPGGYCSDPYILKEASNSYVKIEGTYPANLNEDELTNAYLYMSIECTPLFLNGPLGIIGSSPEVLIYIDNIVMINQAYPDAYPLPVANSAPSPTTSSTQPKRTLYTANDACVYTQESRGSVGGAHQDIQRLRAMFQTIMDRNQQSIASTQQSISATTDQSQISELQAVLDVLQKGQGDLQSLLSIVRPLMCNIDKNLYRMWFGALDDPNIVQVPA
jgi:hypothetical protein